MKMIFVNGYWHYCRRYTILKSLSLKQKTRKNVNTATSKDYVTSKAMRMCQNKNSLTACFFLGTNYTDFTDFLYSFSEKSV